MRTYNIYYEGTICAYVTADRFAYDEENKQIEFITGDRIVAIIPSNYAVIQQTKPIYEQPKFPEDRIEKGAYRKV